MAHSSFSEVHAFALRSTGELRKLVKSLCEKQRRKGGEPDRLGVLLNSGLYLIENWLQENPAQKEEAQIINILSLLQCICEGDSKRKVYPGKSPEEKYPSLANLLKGPLCQKEIAKSLHVLLSGDDNLKDARRSRKNRDGFIKRVDAITRNIAESTSAGVVDPVVEATPEEDFSAHANALYDVLARYNVCHDGGTAAEIIPKISLKGYEKHSESGSTFNVLFPGHPHGEGVGPEYRWRTSVVQVPPEVAFGNDTAHARQIEYHEFCGTITHQQHEQLFLTVSKKDSKLCEMEVKDADPENAWMKVGNDSRTISLRKILAEGHFDGLNLSHVKMQVNLFYLLAKGVWQFYDTRLLSQHWTKDSVEFLFEYRPRDSDFIMGIFLNQPLVSTCHNTSAPASQSAQSIVHPFPKLLALGIMMVEVITGRQIEHYYPKFPIFLGSDQNPTSLTDLGIARHLYEHNIKKDRNLMKQFKNAIETCLDGRRFQPLKSEDPSQLREAIYEKLVRPLETALHMYEDCDDLDPLFSSEATGPKPRSRQISFQHDKQGQHMGYRNSENWFEKLDDVNWLLHPCHNEGERDRDYKKRRVKIAVLDTGISEELFKRITEDDDHEYKDFVSGEDDQKQDSPGHGSDTVRLITRMVDECTFYIARVFESVVANDTTPSLVASAIKWAVMEKSVDIIVLALGFSEPQNEIKKAINMAVKRDVIIFAAAGNEGCLEKVAFPARLLDVMSIFATTARNERWELNPSPEPLTSNFAILGVDIEFPDTGIRSGTSLATAIAAGFAGSIINFSRQPVDEVSNDGWDQLDICSWKEMQKIFSRLSDQNGGYDCIRPWKILDDVPKTGERGYKRKKLRDILAKWTQE